MRGFIFAIFILLCQDADSYKTMQCVEQNGAPPVIAFYAYMSHSFKALSAKQPFCFDAVETNLGKGYDRKTGIFTAPSAGVYAFSWTIQASGTHHSGSSGNYGETVAVLIQNGVTRGAIHVDTETKYDDASSSGFAILSAQKGDRFQIISPTQGQGAFSSTNVDGRTSFAGYRIA